MHRAQLTDPRPPDQESRDALLLVLLQRVWTYSLTTKSDLARVYADEVAEGASRGFLTTEVVPGRDIHGRLWKMTPKGTSFLFDNASVIADEEVTNYVESFGPGV